MNNNKIHLYCFPFVGGSRFSFYPFIKIKPDWLEIVPIELPGHGLRLSETPLDNINTMIDDVQKTLLNKLRYPFAFWGHSLGSLIAYLLTVRLNNQKKPLPLHLFLSGRGGACIPERYRGAYSLTKQEVIDEINSLGDITNLLNRPRAFDSFEHVLRADIAALEGYCYPSPAKLNVNATVLIGDNDLYDAEQAKTWQKEFNPIINLEVLSGGHFFIYEHAQAIINIIERDLHQNIIHFNNHRVFL